MSERTRKPLTNNQRNSFITLQHNGNWYKLPRSVAERYRMANTTQTTVPAESLFSDINKQYTRASALLRGLRHRENLTQIKLAKKLKVRQSDVSQMECGRRKIGREIAKRIEKQFGMNYREFLE